MNKPSLRAKINSLYHYNSIVILLKEVFYPFIAKNSALSKEYKLAVNKTSRKSKETLTEEILPFFAHKKLFLALLASLPEYVQTVVEELVWHPHYTSKEISSRFEIDIVKKSYDSSAYIYHYYNVIEPPFLLFQVEHLERGNFVLGFDDELRSHLSDFFEEPASHKIQAVKSGEINKKLLLFDKNQAVFTELPVLHSLYMHGQIKLNDSNQKPSIASLNKTRKFCNIEEFYTAKEVDKAFLNVRTQFLVEAIINDEFNSHKFNTLATHDFIKYFYINFKNGLYETERLLPHIKGYHYIYENNFNHHVNKDFHEILLNLPQGEWVSVENICKYAIFKSKKFEIIPLKQAYNALYINIKDFYSNRMAVSKMNYSDLIVTPIIKSFFMLCASLGMLDIYYEVPTKYLGGYGDEKSIFPYEGIKYIRLTDLGLYIIGKNDTYQPPQQDQTEIKLDEDNLLIHYASENKALLGMIESISRTAGNHLFKVDFETVLGRCNTYQEIEAQIHTFERLLSDNPPQIWKDFFASLQEKSYTIANQNEEYFIYVLPDNKELVNLFAKDKYLKQHVIRAEYYHILIRKKSLSAVKKYLKKSGFLIEFNSQE